MTINKTKISFFLISCLCVGLTISNILLLYKQYSFKFDDEIIEHTGDELSRVKYFVIDWYNDLSSLYNSLQIYYNELRYENGQYSITIAADRIRAVYPKGIRFFQMEYVTYGEFFKENGFLQCRLYYNETGTLIFKLN